MDISSTSEASRTGPFGSLPIAEHRTRQRLLEAAVAELGGAGYNDDLLDRILGQTGYSRERSQTFFRSGDDIVMALYSRFASDLESRIAELPEGTLAERFSAAMRIKIELMTPYRKALRGLAGRLARRKGRLGVFSPETETIRIRVQGVLNAVIEGASDNDGRSSEVLSRTLYSLYLAIMWLWMRGRADTRMDGLLNAVSGIVSFSKPHLAGGLFRLPLKFFSNIQRSVFFEEDAAATEKAREILDRLFTHRRLHRHAGNCAASPCGQCLALHLPKTAYFVSTGRPVHFILPAFPAKSPNRRKTLGKLPDMAEERGLLYLAGVCRELRELHPAGVRLTICSDGHVFSDLVGVADEDVTAYGEEVRRMVDRLGIADTIDTFSLREIYEDLSLHEMRAHLNRHYELPITAVRERAAKNPQSGAMVNGIHRFLFEDNAAAQPGRSRTQIRNECRDLAYSVVQRSDGWSRLLADCFPMALRLSIHPQEAHSDKIGILLGEADDVWMTPWHSVAVKKDGRFVMMKRADAEEAGARPADGFYELET